MIGAGSVLGVDWSISSLIWSSLSTVVEESGVEEGGKVSEVVQNGIMILRIGESHPIHQQPTSSAWSHRPNLNGLLPLWEGLGILVIRLRMERLVTCQTPATVSLEI